MLYQNGLRTNLCAEIRADEELYNWNEYKNNSHILYSSAIPRHIGTLLLFLFHCKDAVCVPLVIAPLNFQTKYLTHIFEDIILYDAEI